MRCRLLLLLEGVKDVDGLGQRSDVDDPVSSGGVPNSDLANAGADRLDRLSIVRIESALKPFDLETGLASGSIREPAQIRVRRPEENDRLHAQPISEWISTAKDMPTPCVPCRRAMRLDSCGSAVA